MRKAQLILVCIGLLMASHSYSYQLGRKASDNEAFEAYTGLAHNMHKPVSIHQPKTKIAYGNEWSVIK